LSDHEAGIGDVHVDRQGREEETGQAAHREQSDEAEGIEDRRIVDNGPLVESRRPYMLL
jgi:hypothetical protein